MSKPSTAVRARYEARNYKQIKLSLNVNTEADVIAKLDSVGNRRGYIIALIREDIAKAKEEAER